MIVGSLTRRVDPPPSSPASKPTNRSPFLFEQLLASIYTPSHHFQSRLLLCFVFVFVFVFVLLLPNSCASLTATMQTPSRSLTATRFRCQCLAHPRCSCCRRAQTHRRSASTTAPLLTWCQGLLLFSGHTLQTLATTAAPPAPRA